MAAALLSAYRWRRWLSLTADERALLLRSLLMLARARFTLARQRFQAAAPLAEEAGADPAADPTTTQAQRARAHHVARLVAYAAALCPVRTSNAQRVWVLWQQLRRAGIPCTLRSDAEPGLGLGPLAWVECQGQPLREVADPYQAVPLHSTPVLPADKA